MSTTNLKYFLRAFFCRVVLFTAVFHILFFESLPQADAPKNEVQAAGEAVRNDTRAAASDNEAENLGIDEKGRAIWLELEPGLDYGEFRLEGDEAKISAIRIDPSKYEFLLGASTNADGKSRTLHQWVTECNLSCAINASMYLPDGKTSTGYMRSGIHINNPRIGSRLGAFFVASPKKSGLPGAALVDKDDPGWRDKLDEYDIVIQNYRLINSGRQILWPPGGGLFSISAVAQDGGGKILFLHSRTPVEIYDFAQRLLHLPLDVRTVMYVEGGAQAGLVVRTEKMSRELTGLHAPSFLATGNSSAPLPNILGARPGGVSKNPLQR